MTRTLPLTSLRGFFAIYVLLYHTANDTPGGRPDIPFLARGYLSVDFFFVLSGFILAMVYGRAPHFEYRRFVWTRACRLFPAHLLVLSLAALYMGVPNPIYFWQEATLTNGVYRPLVVTMINGVDWSLSLEWLINLAFPILLWLTCGRRLWLTLGACAFSLLGLVLTVGSLCTTSVDTSFPVQNEIRALSEISLGACFTKLPKFSISDRTLTILAGIGLMLLIVPHTDLLCVALFSFLIVTLPNSPGFWHRVLSQPTFVWLGEISFSVYLWHVPLLHVLQPFLVPLRGTMPDYTLSLVFAALIVGSVLTLAHLTYRYIEMPARDWGRRQIASWTSASGIA